MSHDKPREQSHGMTGRGNPDPWPHAPHRLPGLAGLAPRVGQTIDAGPRARTVLPHKVAKLALALYRDRRLLSIRQNHSVSDARSVELQGPTPPAAPDAPPHSDLPPPTLALRGSGDGGAQGPLMSRWILRSECK